MFTVQVINFTMDLATPLVTPFDDSKNIDFESLEHLLTQLTDRGIKRIMPAGTTGEFASLTKTEIMSLLEFTVDFVPSDTEILIGGFPPNIAEARQWSRNVMSAGASVGVLTAPYFHTSNGPDGIFDFFDAVGKDSDLPLIIYNIPSCVGEDIPLGVIERLSREKAYIGLKDSSGRIEYGLAAKEICPEGFKVYQGFDALLQQSLQIGFDGGINALSNAFPEKYLELCQSPDSQESNVVHAKIIEPVFRTCLQYGFAPSTKAVLERRGWIQTAVTRPPLQSTSLESLDLSGAFR